MSHLGQVPSVGPVVSHGLSMPSVSRELTQLLTSYALQGQSSPSVSTTHDHFINSHVSTNTVPWENYVNNAENRIVCHSKSSVVNFYSNAHSHSDSHTDIRDDIISSITIFCDTSRQHISNSEANESDNLIGVSPSIKDKRFSQESHFDKFERKMDSHFDQLNADMCIIVEKYCASIECATRHVIHEHINKIQTPVSPVSGTNPSEKGNHYRKSGDNAQPLVSANISSHQLEKTVSQVLYSYVTGKSENISHNSHNSKFTDNTFDIRHESHKSLISETSDRDKLIPVKKSAIKIPQRSNHTGVHSHVIRWKMFVFIAGNMVILLMSALICVHPVGLIKTQTGGTQWSSEMYMSPKMAAGISISLQHRIALTNMMYLQFKTI